MKVMWCWHCRKDVPMLDEDEFRQLDQVYLECIEEVKRFRKDHQAGLNEVPLGKLHEPIRKEYERLTGIVTDIAVGEIYRHRISLYGEPCGLCGKPLRTPKAAYCAECGSLASK